LTKPCNRQEALHLALAAGQKDDAAIMQQRLELTKSTSLAGGLSE